MTEATEVVRVNSVSIEDNSRGSTHLMRPDISTAEITTRYINGESSKNIARALHCSSRTVILRLRAAGVAVRGQGKVKPFGPGNHNWKGGRHFDGKYWYLSVKGRKIAEHRYVIERLLGRTLRDDEQVHHIDHDGSNNHPDNLIVLSESEHARLHRRQDRKDHCPAGHPMDGANARIRKHGQYTTRACRACARAYRERRKAER